MSKIMIMDTSSEYLIVSFLVDDKVVFEYIAKGKNNHSDNLLKEIEIGLNETNLQVEDFDKIICGVGPGAYTGLRVGLTVAKMFTWTLNKDLYVISSLDIMATKYLNTNKVVSIDMKAKKDFVYHKIVKFNNGKIEILDSEAFMSLDDARSHNSKFEIDEFVNNDNINYEALNVDALSKKVTSIDLLEPNYLREGM